MCVEMDMSSYEIERSEAEYGDEVLCSGYIPVAGLACQTYPAGQAGRPMSLPPSLADVDAEAFLQRMYAYQR